MSNKFHIGDGVALVSEGGTDANGTVVDFVYAAHEPDDHSLIRVYWRTSGGASDHSARELVRVT